MYFVIQFMSMLPWIRSQGHDARLNAGVQPITLGFLQSVEFPEIVINGTKNIWH